MIFYVFFKEIFCHFRGSFVVRLGVVRVVVVVFVFFFFGSFKTFFLPCGVEIDSFIKCHSI